MPRIVTCTDFSRLESPGVPSYFTELLKGVIRCPKLGNCSEEEILEGTRSQGVNAIKRFKVKRNGVLKNTNTFVFTFNTSVLSKTIKVAYFRVNVEVYIPNPLRCHQCQKYGHHEDRCSKDPVCSKSVR